MDPYLDMTELSDAQRQEIRQFLADSRNYAVARLEGGSPALRQTISRACDAALSSFLLRLARLPVPGGGN